MSSRELARSGKQLVHTGHALTIDRRFEDLSGFLVSAPHEWFPRSIGVHIVGIPVRKRIKVEFGESIETSTVAVVRVSWKATFPQALFPKMEGKVSLSRAGKSSSRLTVSGLYVPPLGRLGEELNEALLHRVADRTVENLAESIARKLRKA